MTGTILPPERLRLCALALARPEGDAHGQPGAVERRELEPLLASALIGPAACDEYLTALASAFCGEAVGEPFVPDFLPDVVLREGLSALSDEQLFRLARNPSAIREMNRVVEGALTRGTVGPYWIEAELLPSDALPAEYHAAAANAVEQFRRLERETRPRTETLSRRWVKAALPFALAASLLLAFFLGTRWPGGPGEVRLASLSVRGEPARGIGTVALDIENASDRRAFVTVVGLVPGRDRPVYHYRSEGRYLDAPPQSTVAVTNLPPEFQGATVLVVFLTRVPAGEAVREGSAAASADAAEAYAARTRKALAELGIDSDSKVVPLPSAVR